MQKPTQTKAAQKQGKETRSNLSTKSTHKTTIHETCNISSHDMHEGAKEQSVIKANHSAVKSEEPQHHAQPISRWKSSIPDLQERHTVDHHSSVVFRHDDSAGHHLDDSIGPFRRDNSSDR
ncbi:hypothetical protein F511_21437 [Dorcoceras hygrometricum]|uniref:Uncharacterized protein n=1 Tax=Dorcoceras hygrometricum TaxID=472368 RepID=A0A2Z7CU48_9LAMI|nr:hypothetical protein F511_21437 [Dorcoceras hygrometricum]